MESSIPLGIAGAVTVAVAVLALDWLGGRPLATPNALGATVFRGAEFNLLAPIEGILVFGYTLLHTAAFVIAATAAVSVEKTLRSLGVSLRTQFFVGIPALFLCLHLGSLAMFSVLGISLESFGSSRLLAINGLAAMGIATAFWIRAIANPTKEGN
ncbi:MAG: hypothetical protein AB8G23_06070 [Myxococcota bacterium]